MTRTQINVVQHKLSIASIVIFAFSVFSAEQGHYVSAAALVAATLIIVYANHIISKVTEL